SNGIQDAMEVFRTMILLQVLIIIFAAIMILSALIQLQKEKLTIEQAIMWGIVWLMLIFLTVFTNVLSRVASILGVERGVDLLIYTSIIILFIAFYHVQIRQ